MNENKFTVDLKEGDWVVLRNQWCIGPIKYSYSERNPKLVWCCNDEFDWYEGGTYNKGDTPHPLDIIAVVEEV